MRDLQLLSPYRSGQKVARFGQQTNMCVGLQLEGDRITSVSVDGVVRTFSIVMREMIGQYNVFDLVGHVDTLSSHMQATAGSGSGRMLTWFAGQGPRMFVSNRLAWIRG
jgi:pyrimidine and pyridine-specific 5'-nucleotidase